MESMRIDNPNHESKIQENVKKALEEISKSNTS
jgi:hypothetical protein